jgi:hypothetical protein
VCNRVFQFKKIVGVKTSSDEEEGDQQQNSQHRITLMYYDVKKKTLPLITFYFEKENEFQAACGHFEELNIQHRLRVPRSLCVLVNPISGKM